jgi:hypothetical protein
MFLYFYIYGLFNDAISNSCSVASIYLANNYLFRDSHIKWVPGRDTGEREIRRGKAVPVHKIEMNSYAYIVNTRPIGSRNKKALETHSLTASM